MSNINVDKKPMQKHYDYLVVGAGLTSAVFSDAAKKAGKSVLVIEKREHIAGNIYTKRVDGIDIHEYGAHIFHTSDKDVWNYVNRFSEFNNYINSPVARYGNEIYNLPFNMNTFVEMWGEKASTPAGAKSIIDEQRADIVKMLDGREPANLEEQAMSLIGKDIYEKLIKGYTEKQWGRDCTELPASIIKRLPVRMIYDNNYFNHRYQGIPIDGYTAMVEKMFGETEILLDTEYKEFVEQHPNIADKTVYCGPIDEFFDYALGQLEYRSLRFETERIDTDNWQGNAVVNYTEREIPFTRIIEHKHFMMGEWRENGNNVTFITREYPADWNPGDEPYYPVNNDENEKLYKKYEELGQKQEKVIFAGRLGAYKYYDMDACIAAAFDLVKSELGIDFRS